MEMRFIVATTEASAKLNPDNFESYVVKIRMVSSKIDGSDKRIVIRGEAFRASRIRRASGYPSRRRKKVTISARINSFMTRRSFSNTRASVFLARSWFTSRFRYAAIMNPESTKTRTEVTHRQPYPLPPRGIRPLSFFLQWDS